MESENLTVLKALTLAGGATRGAKLDAATIVRRGPNGTTATVVPLKEILAAKAPDPALEPNDILYVPTYTAKLVGLQLAQAAIQAATAVGVALAVRLSLSAVPSSRANPLPEPPRTMPRLASPPTSAEATSLIVPSPPQAMITIPAPRPRPPPPVRARGRPAPSSAPRRSRLPGTGLRERC